MFKSGALLTIGNMISAITLMVRNIIVARLISVEDMGIASTFAITMALLEMLTDFALDQMLIQDRDGGEPRMKGTLQLLQVLRGFLAGGVLYFLAGIYADLMNVPDIAWAFQVVALVPVLRGLAHLDIFQEQRNLNYKPFVLALVLPQLISVIALWPLSYWVTDFRIMLYAIMIQQVLYMVLSHLTAKSRFSFAWDASVFWRAFYFGWPLFLNGILMFVILNGDRIIVANVMGMTELGLFAVAYTITLAPVLMLAKTLQAFFLPQLSSRQDDRDSFNRLAMTVIETHFAIAALFAVGIILAGPPVFILLFGEKYTDAQTIFVWLGLVQAVRLAKGAPSVIAMARSFTKNPLIANVVRVLSLPVAYMLIQSTGNILMLAWAALGAEILSLLVAFWLLRRELSLPLRPVLPALLAFFVVCVILMIDINIAPPQAGLFENIHLFQLVLLASLVGVLTVSPHLRGVLFKRDA